MATYMTDDLVPRWSTFTTDNDLNPDTFIVFQDVDKSHSDMIERYYTLKNKTYTTDAEKTEMTQLAVNLQEYLPTSDTWNKLCACIRGMHIYMRDGVVVFYEQKKQEFENLLKQYKDRGDWNATTTFVLGNLVKHNGYGFMSTFDGSNLNHEPNENVSSDTYWTRYTIKGDKGDPSLNINYKGEYSSTTTYAIGDACSLNQIMYYAKQNATIGISPTDNTKWACVDKFIVSGAQPTDIHIVWWDTTVNKLKRYNGNDWIIPTINASDVLITDSANYFISTNVEGALSELGSIYTTTNVGNVYSITVPNLISLTDGYPITVKFNVASTGSIALKVNNLVSRSIVDYFGSSVTNVRANLIVNLRYEIISNSFILQGKGGDGNATPNQLLLNATATTKNGQIVGTMPNKGDMIITPTSQNISIPMGFHGGNGYVQGVTPKSLGGYGVSDYILSNNIERQIIEKFTINITTGTGIIRTQTDGLNNCYIFNTSGLIKYDFIGNQIWKKDISNNYYKNLCTDNSNNVIISITNTVTKYDANGSQLWTYTPPTCESIDRMKTDVFGNIILAVYNYTNPCRIVKLNTNGSVVWDISMTYANVSSSGITTDEFGNVYYMASMPQDKYGNSFYYFTRKIGSSGNIIISTSTSSAPIDNASLVYVNNYLYEATNGTYDYGTDPAGIGKSQNDFTALPTDSYTYHAYDGFNIYIGACAKDGKYLYLIKRPGEFTMTGNQIIKMNVSDLTELWSYTVPDNIQDITVDNNGEVWYVTSSNKIGVISERYLILK